ncbi:hypothetical protein [Streptococcus pluranimalium]|uniref:hypothetical protein n=1 Tax=Streptococcus pluranimalium TaxID=82348 RepID=UPI003F67717C
MSNKPFNLAEARAENFSNWLYEAFDLANELANDGVVNPEDYQNDYDRLFEILCDFTDMWELGQIMVSSQEH